MTMHDGYSGHDGLGNPAQEEPPPALGTNSPPLHALALTPGDCATFYRRYADMADLEDAVALLEDLESEGRRLKLRDENRKLARQTVESVLAGRLGEGEAIPAPSGRFAYLGEVADGKATVNQEAAQEYAYRLSEAGLAPRIVTKYPTVTDIRDAVRKRRIPRDVARAVLIMPPKRAGIRWMTPEGDVEGDDL